MGFQLIKNEPLLIPLPAEGYLRACHGFDMAARYITPMQDAIVNGPKKVLITIPEEKEPYPPGAKTCTILGEFFLGLFLDMMKATQEAHMPQLKHEAARADMRAVAGTAVEEPAIDEIVEIIFDKPWITYAPLEALFWQRVSFGLVLANGGTFIADISPNYEFLNYTNNQQGDRLSGWIDKASKGLSGIFSGDFNWILDKNRELQWLGKPMARPA